MRNSLEKISHLLTIKNFAVLFVVFSLLSVWLLRQNNLHMVNLREEVIALDAETGDIKQIQPKLDELGNYVLNHMNTNMGSPLELPGTYNERVEQIRKKVEQSGSANSEVYARAQTVCEDPSVLLTVRAQCVQDYVSNNSVPGSDAEELEFPDKALYSYSFVSPAWSPDLAGFSVLISLLSLLTLTMIFIAKIFLPFLGRWIDSDPLE